MDVDSLPTRKNQLFSLTRSSNKTKRDIKFYFTKNMSEKLGPKVENGASKIGSLCSLC